MAAQEKGYTFFGLQYFGECWSGLNSRKTPKRHGKSKKCLNEFFGECEKEDEGNCVGGENANYVFEVIG